MGRTYDDVDDRLATWLLGQPVFFVATAPSGGGGHLNCSPKSNNGELAVLSGSCLAYLDRTGSGAETIAHLLENGRILLMFCSFAGSPRIVRIHGRGKVHFRGSEEFCELEGRFREQSVLGSRSIVTMEVDRIADSCGYGVPFMAFEGHRQQADAWHARKGEEGVREYWSANNAVSLDGLPGVPPRQMDD
ncbi:MAG: pyridoxamine 5'-phosphate oxidase family protein [Acidimicrobiales bacterium]